MGIDVNLNLRDNEELVAKYVASVYRKLKKSYAEQQRGHLYLTNQRLIFFVKERKKFIFDHEVPLKKIIEISYNKGLTTQSSIIINGLNYYITGADVAHIFDIINKLRGKPDTPHPEAPIQKVAKDIKSFVGGIFGKIKGTQQSQQPPPQSQSHPSQSSAIPPLNDERKYIFCPVCGTQLPANAKFCMNCGEQINF
ncbi:MAG: zinc-ribbon domain-containing protein [Promethearchaeota archaeon]